MHKMTCNKSKQIARARVYPKLISSLDVFSVIRSAYPETLKNLDLSKIKKFVFHILDIVTVSCVCIFILCQDPARVRCIQDDAHCCSYSKETSDA